VEIFSLGFFRATSVIIYPLSAKYCTNTLALCGKFDYCFLFSDTRTNSKKCKWSRNMPYINRNDQGEITQLLDMPSGEGSQWLELNHPDVVEFLQRPANETELKKSLESSDGDMVRVVEDLVDVLMEKQVFVFTELPEAVQAKLNARKKLRHDVSAISNLIADDDGIL